MHEIFLRRKKKDIRFYATRRCVVSRCEMCLFSTCDRAVVTEARCD